MSVPVPSCLICKAALGNDAAFKELVARMRINLKHRAWTQIPCKCNPRCEIPTEDQLTDLNDRMMNEINNG